MSEDGRHGAEMIAVLAALERAPGAPRGAAPTVDEIDAWRRGELRGERAAAVFSHLAGDPACTALLRELEALDALAEEPSAAPRRATRAGALERLRGWLSRRPAVPPWGGALAAACLLVAVVVGVLDRGGGGAGELLAGDYARWRAHHGDEMAVAPLSAKAFAVDGAALATVRAGARAAAQAHGWLQEPSWAAWAARQAPPPACAAGAGCAVAVADQLAAGRWLTSVVQDCLLDRIDGRLQLLDAGAAAAALAAVAPPALEGLAAALAAGDPRGLCAAATAALGF